MQTNSNSVTIPKSAAAARGPEQVRVLVVTCRHDLAVSRHDARGAEVVYGRAEPARQPPDSAAQREARHTRVSDDPGRCCAAESLGRRVEVPEECTCLDARDPRERIDVRPAHRREVDDHAVVAHRVAGDAVASAAHGHLEIALAREPQRGHDVVGVAAACDHSRPPVDRSVRDPPGFLIRGVSWVKGLAAEPACHVRGCEHVCTLTSDGGQRKTRKWTRAPNAWQHSGREVVWSVLPDCARRRDLRQPLDAGDRSQPLLGCETFNEIRAGAPGISRTLLSQRLRELERSGVIERRPGPAAASPTS